MQTQCHTLCQAGRDNAETGQLSMAFDINEVSCNRLPGTLTAHAEACCSVSAPIYTSPKS